jgi:hypothetical protein
MEITKEERDAYCLGYTSVDYGCMVTDRYPTNPYDPLSDDLLWEAWEVGFNDRFEDKVTVIRIIEDMHNGKKDSIDD